MNKLSWFEIEQAKDRVTIYDIARTYYPAWKPTKSCKSPFREDKNPSFSVYDNGKRYKDFATGEKGDVIDFLARAANLSRKEAFKRFVELAGISTHQQAPKGKWPEFTRGTSKDIQVLASLRNLTPEAAQLAQDRGLLWFTTVKDQNELARAWVLCERDRNCALVRRMDGKVWKHLSGGPKSKTLAGSVASWPIGLTEAKDFPAIALVEGGPDFLAAFHFIWEEEMENIVAPVLLSSASVNIHNEALPLFSGKRVRIFPHMDSAGYEAAIKWEHQLQPICNSVECFDLSDLIKTNGDKIKDLNDLTLMSADLWELDRETHRLMDFAGGES